MRIDRLELTGFRNYRDQAADFDPECNVIFGENAQGKTNLLEAIVYLSCGKSPRARTDRELIGFEGDAARLCARVSKSQMPHFDCQRKRWSRFFLIAFFLAHFHTLATHAFTHSLVLFHE